MYLKKSYSICKYFRASYVEYVFMLDTYVYIYESYKAFRCLLV